MYLTKKILLYAFLALVSWVLFCISSSAVFDESSLFKLFIPLLGLLTLYKPLLGISIFILLTPFFGGSKPEDSHTVRFYTIFAVINLALLINFLTRQIFFNSKAHIKLSHPLVFILAIYWLVACLSLISVPPNQIVLSIFEFHSTYTRQFLNLSEESQIYPYLAFFTLSATMMFGFFLAELAALNEHTFVLYGVFLGGLALTIFLGLMDYYDAINLNLIRPWYFLVAGGENYRFQHLTSVFGNPGWYAQYLVLGAPSLLYILALNLKKEYKLIVLIFLMVITEYTIILIYQRGGWLSYPITLLIIWFCIYIFDDGQDRFDFKSSAFKRASIKIVLSLPITIAISLSVIYFISKGQPESRQQLAGFMERAESIKNAGDRLMFFQPSLELAKAHPIFGPGLESFAYESKKMYQNNIAVTSLGGAAKSSFIPIYGSAHNLYFQAMSGKGFLGLASLLALIITTLVVVWNGIAGNTTLSKEPRLAKLQRLSLMMTLGFICAMSIYGNVGEIFYSPSGYIVFAIFLFITIGIVPTDYEISKRLMYSIFVFLGLAFIVHVSIEFSNYIFH